MIGNREHLMPSILEIKKGLRVVFGTPQGRAIVFYRPAAVVAGGIVCIVAISVMAKAAIWLIS
jgi:hypothetical protein